eukprot:6180029-Pleurochrysis_carterae.AAC.6
MSSRAKPDGDCHLLEQAQNAGAYVEQRENVPFKERLDAMLSPFSAVYFRATCDDAARTTHSSIR